MKNILIIGGGSIGKRHVRNLLTFGQKNIYVVEPNEKRAKDEIEKEMGLKTFRSLENAFDQIKFDMVFVCSPSIFHIDQALYCVKKDCDIFIEKPISHDLIGTKKLLNEIKKRKLIGMMGSNWKFYPLFQKMKALLDEKKIGKVLSVRCQFGQYLPDWHPWEDHRKGYSANKKLGGGVLLESHEFDYITWFLGDVKKIACFADRISDVTVDTEDTAEVILKFENGATGEMHFDYLQRFYQRDFQFVGEKGTILWNVNDKKVILFIKDKEKEEFLLDLKYDVNNMYVEEIKHFLDCVEKRKETVTSIERGVMVLKLICAAKESAKNNKIIKI